MPANAILIDNSDTAESITINAVATGSAVVSALSAETSTPLSAKDIINIVFDKVDGNIQNSTPIVAGVDLSGDLCLSGNASGDEAETSTSYIASVTFNACEVDIGTIFTGTLSINKTFSASGSGPYTNAASGNLTVTFTSNGNSVGFNGFDYAETGDTSTGAYTVSSFTYTIAPSTGGGFAVQLTDALVGTTNSSCELSAGQVLITGASGSQARGTVNTDGSVKVEYHSGDGNFIETDNSPLPCLI